MSSGFAVADMEMRVGLGIVLAIVMAALWTAPGSAIGPTMRAGGNQRLALAGTSDATAGVTTGTGVTR